jgi:hypothetical protein
VDQIALDPEEVIDKLDADERTPVGRRRIDEVPSSMAPTSTRLDGLARRS